jgi:hypothetical protein
LSATTPVTATSRRSAAAPNCCWACGQLLLVVPLLLLGLRAVGRQVLLGLGVPGVLGVDRPLQGLRVLLVLGRRLTDRAGGGPVLLHVVPAGAEVGQLVLVPLLGVLGGHRPGRRPPHRLGVPLLLVRDRVPDVVQLALGRPPADLRLRPVGLRLEPGPAVADLPDVPLVLVGRGPVRPPALAHAGRLPGEPGLLVPQLLLGRVHLLDDLLVALPERGRGRQPADRGGHERRRRHDAPRPLRAVGVDPHLPCAPSVRRLMPRAGARPVAARPVGPNRRQ